MFTHKQPDSRLLLLSWSVLDFRGQQRANLYLPILLIIEPYL
uniref:Uncharacterized protein n=1 Tax=Anguilla anguilla TaxID=7936 RepID=A0A0E9QH48_ANGAN